MNQILTPERNRQIGGSEAAAILGVSQYSDAVKVYMLKTGMIEPDDANFAMRFGTHNEPLIADFYSEHRGNIVLVEPDLITSEDNPFMIGHIDRLAMKDGKLPAMGEIWVADDISHGVEIKTANSRVSWKWGDEETDAVPDDYMAQVQHYMAVCPWIPFFEMAVWIGGSELKTYRVHRSDKMINLLIEVEGEFMQNLEKGIAPDITGSKSSKEYLAIKYKESDNTEIEVVQGDEAFPIIERFVIVKKERDLALKQYDFSVNKVKELMKSANRLKCNGATISLSKASVRETVDYKTVLKDLQQILNIPKDMMDKITADYTKTTDVARSLRPNFKGWVE